MKQNRRRNLLLGVLCGMLCNSLAAQDTFRFNARLDSVSENGFYNIPLSPQILAKSKRDAEDVRILDRDGREIPYILYTESARPNEDAFTEFPVSYSDNRLSVIINNILPGSLDKLYLLIKNSEARRAATLSGSDDAAHWFVIKENIILQNEYSASGDNFVQSVSFPLSSYKYFRVAMAGKNVLPLNIVKAGVYRHSVAGSVYDTLPAPQRVQKDSSNKRSYIWLSFTDSYVINKLDIVAAGAKFFRRTISVHDKNTVNAPVMQDVLSSAGVTGIDFQAKTSRLLLVIDNRDNTPLSITSVSALQLHTSVTAYLEKGNRYSLYFGDSAAIMPSYDLQYFNDSIGSNIHALGVSNIEANTNKKENGEKQSDSRSWILYVILIIVLLSLLYFSFRMIKDINNKTKDNVDL